MVCPVDLDVVVGGEVGPLALQDVNELMVASAGYDDRARTGALDPDLARAVVRVQRPDLHWVNGLQRFVGHAPQSGSAWHLVHMEARAVL